MNCEFFFSAHDDPFERYTRTPAKCIWKVFRMKIYDVEFRYLRERFQGNLCGTDIWNVQNVGLDGLGRTLEPGIRRVRERGVAAYHGEYLNLKRQV